jgi:hypothetical protein
LPWTVRSVGVNALLKLTEVSLDCVLEILNSELTDVVTKPFLLSETFELEKVPAAKLSRFEFWLGLIWF